jgi:hypothetical protein
MFRRRKQDSGPAELFDRMRGLILHRDPADEGLARTPGSPMIWGGMMEMGLPRGTASLICLRNGATSMYTSTGGGMIGGEAHPAVVSANGAFLAALAAHLHLLRADTDETLPPTGRVVFRAMTYDGPMTFEAAEDELEHGRSPLSPVYEAGHDVLTEFRLIHERHSAST